MKLRLWKLCFALLGAFGVLFCWWGMTHCSHSSDVGVICRTNQTLREVRLVGSNDYEGRVEVKIAGIWGTINDLGWDIYDANVFCRQLGWAGASGAYNRGHYGLGKGPIWLSRVSCSGSESALWKCNLTQHQFQKSLRYRNPHDRDAGAECFDLRLVGSKSRGEGILQIKYLGTWGTICNDSWDVNDAKVVCRQMGYSKVGSVTNIVVPDDIPSPLLTGFHCKGDEPSLGICSFKLIMPYSKSCSQSSFARVACTHPISQKCNSRCNQCQRTVKYGGVCVCSIEHTDVNIYSWCDAVIGLHVIDVQVLNRTLSQWNAGNFKKLLANQLNIYCRNRSCTSDRNYKFEVDDIIILDDYPKASKGQNFGLRFMVLDGDSQKPISDGIIYNMFKYDHILAGYNVKFVKNVKTHAHARSGMSSKKLKWAIPIVVGAVIAGILLALYVFIRKRNHRRSRSVVRYHVANSNFVGGQDNVACDDHNDDQLLDLDNDQAPLLPSS